MDAPAMPRTEADLAEWSVFADHLLTIGDPRGEALAMELALPVQPSRDQVKAFQALCPRLPASDAALQFGYQLGHVVTLSIAPGPHLKMARSRIASPLDGSLGRALDLVTTPLFAQLRELIVPVGVLEPNFLRLLRRLPASCTRIVLAIGHATPELVDALIAALPPQIVEVSLWRCGADTARRFFLDRFARIELARTTGELDIGKALDTTTSTTAHVQYAYEPLHPRLHLTPSGMLEPARSPVYDLFARASHMFTTTDPSATSFSPRGLLEQQARFGIIPVRSQLSGELPQQHNVSFGNTQYVEVMRVADRWTIRSQDAFVLDGHEIAANTIVPLADDARVTLAGKTLEFTTHDLEGRFRARCRGG